MWDVCGYCKGRLIVQSERKKREFWCWRIENLNLTSPPFEIKMRQRDSTENWDSKREKKLLLSAVAVTMGDGHSFAGPYIWNRGEWVNGLQKVMWKQDAWWRCSMCVTLKIMEISLYSRLTRVLFAPQRKELGVLVYDCSCLALDLHRVFNLYWGLKYKDFIPSFWSKRLFALFNRDEPLELTLNSTKAQAYISVGDTCSNNYTSLSLGGETLIWQKGGSGVKSNNCV